jgi:NAD+ diphosphatase
MNEYRFCPLCGMELGPRLVDGRTRPACPSETCGFVHWDNPVPVVAAIVEMDGKVLLVRSASWPEKMFGLVTGFLERDETPEQGVIREVMEETGLRAERTSFLGPFPFSRANQLLLGYHILAAGTVSLSDELAEYRWVERRKLRDWPIGTGVIVRAWLDSIADREPESGGGEPCC